MAIRQKRVPPIAALHRWETVDGQFPEEWTQRMAVPGGWIYRQIEGSPDQTICMVYVPAPPWHRTSQAIRSVADTVITREPADAKPDAVPDPAPRRARHIVA
jgi:hypothetical protein